MMRESMIPFGFLTRKTLGKRILLGLFPVLLSMAIAVPLLSQTTGQPSLGGAIARQGPLLSGAYVVDLRLTNQGTADARSISIDTIAFRTLSGTGTGTLNSLSPSLPLAVGDLAVGASTTVRLFLTLPNTVTRFSLTENGSLQDTAGRSLAFSI